LRHHHIQLVGTLLFLLLTTLALFSLNPNLFGAIAFSSEGGGCPNNCEVCEKLPVREGKVYRHHWDAHTGLWNEEKRFQNINFLDSSSFVVYVGGNTNGADGKKILESFNSSIAIFEPVPSFFAELNKVWRTYITTQGFRAALYNVGLGKDDRVVEASIEGQSTFGMERTAGSGEKKKTKVEKLQIVEAASALRSLLNVRRLRGLTSEISLLHINCEGCEWEMLENLLKETDLIKKVKCLQVGAHYFPEWVVNQNERYCKIRDHLSLTHRLVWGEPYAWERWDRLD